MTSKAWEISGLTTPTESATAPSVTDDSNAGYGVGSRWVDTVANLAYTCVDASVGAAIWSAGGGATAGKHTISIPAGAWRPTQSNGCDLLIDIETTSGRPDITSLDFSATADQFCRYPLLMPKMWDGGTLTYEVKWCVNGTITTDVVWALQGVAISDGDTFDVVYGTAVNLVDSGNGTALDALFTGESGAITIAGSPADGDIIDLRLGRLATHGSDTMSTHKAKLVGVKVFYTTDAENDT